MADGIPRWTPQRSVNVSRELWAQALERARKEGTSVTAVLRRLLRAYVQSGWRWPITPDPAEQRLAVMKVRVPTELWRAAQLRAAQEETALLPLLRYGLRHYVTHGESWRANQQP